MISMATIKGFLPTGAMIKAGLIGAAGVAAVRMIEEKTEIGFDITTGGRNGDTKLLPEVQMRNGVPVTLGIAPIVAAVLINKYL